MIVFVTTIMLTVTPAFADHATASVSAPQGTSVPGCEETNECFIPAEVTVDVGGVVTWSNDDSAAHTVTAGSAADGPLASLIVACLWQVQLSPTRLKKQVNFLTSAWFTHG